MFGICNWMLKAAAWCLKVGAAVAGELGNLLPGSSASMANNEEDRR
jgi:hypothetical protein